MSVAAEAAPRHARSLRPAAPLVIAGLLLSYHINLPAGPAIVLTLGAIYLLSLALGPLGPLASRWRSGWHFER